MKEHEIVAAVRRTAGLEDAEHAAAATRATLTVLGQRLAGGEPGDLAGQLPGGIREALPSTGEGARFGVEEFYRRVMDEEGRGCTQDGAREHARAVVAALKAGVSQGEFDDLVQQLPAEYRDDLLSTAPVTEHR
ncbi:DUF2267 domain-containing protein [Amycolatopsis thermophila]|uniref:Uncharacterized protein (DUF2267 family) n=1 Tax=Amycolatopsis thermophila TaxID=206084 RepID=A0ABU0F2K0_9PSEU|nr:DUF2267 domain-containing protein [Amycolatopsis thermophila]MDQ0381811.1 uncharacterized protein (DUF2267 family) [Amycolatopsis thermophila]